MIIDIIFGGIVLDELEEGMAITRRKLLVGAAATAAFAASRRSLLFSQQRPNSLSKGPLIRIDNVFFNTTDVAKLAKYYSQVLGVPIRREQTLSGSLMWAEIGYGGMELSFRLAQGTPKIHEDLRNDFLELGPGEGATVSFEVENMEKARDELSSKGVKFRGPIIHCTEGQELISIFEDHSGRPVQLYQPNFAPGAPELLQAMRSGSGALVPGEMVDKRIQVGSNLRDVRNLALDVAFNDHDINGVKQFYGDLLQLPVQHTDKNNVILGLEASVIEFRKPINTGLQLAQVSGMPKGGLVAFEVHDLPAAHETLRFSGVTPSGPSKNRRSPFRDPEGNALELWQRS
jgi:predicted enzyme related to lactoylglutathione lyase